MSGFDTSTPVPRERLAARLARLARNSTVYLGGDVVAQGLNLLLFPLYTRYLTPGDYGIFALVQSVTIVLTILFGFSLHGAIARLHFEAETDEERRRLYGSVLAFLVVVPALGASALHLAGNLGGLDLFSEAPYTPYLQYAVGTAYLAVFVQVPVSIYQARQQPRPVMALTILNATALASATILFVVVLEQGALGALRGALTGTAITAVVAIALTLRLSSLHLSSHWISRSLAFSLPLVPHLLGTWILYLSDRIVLERYVSAADLGLYSIGAAVGTAMHFFAVAVGRAFAPAITLALKDPAERKQVPQLGTFWLLGLAWAAVAMSLLLTDVIRVLAPGAFHEATKVVGWIVFGYLAFGVYNVAAQGTYFSMRTRWVPALTLAAGALNVALNFALIPSLGIVGAAIATLIAFVALAVMQGALSQRVYPISWEYGRWTKIVAAALLTFAVGNLGGGETTAWTFAVKVIAILLVMPIALTALGFWRPEERRHLRDVIAVSRL